MCWQQPRLPCQRATTLHRPPPVATSAPGATATRAPVRTAPARAPDATSDSLREAPSALVWIEDRRRERLDAAFGETPPDLTELARIEAFNPNRGKPTVLRLMSRSGDPMLAGCETASTRP